MATQPTPEGTCYKCSQKRPLWPFAIYDGSPWNMVPEAEIHVCARCFSEVSEYDETGRRVWDILPDRADGFDSFSSRTTYRDGELTELVRGPK